MVRRTFFNVSLQLSHTNVTIVVGTAVASETKKSLVPDLWWWWWSATKRAATVWGGGGRNPPLFMEFSVES